MRNIKMKPHPYTKYRPPWCKHPPFEGINYCWTLAVCADEKRLTKWKKGKCRCCDLSKYYDGSMDKIIGREGK
jgi:hypothetical protein